MKNNWKVLLSLHLLLMLYSCSGIFSKLASQESFLSMGFCLCYGAIIFLLGVYAIGWQQIIKRLPLTMAFANKAITVVWGMVWGILFFAEKVTLGKALGILLVVIGVAVFSAEGGDADHE